MKLKKLYLKNIRSYKEEEIVLRIHKSLAPVKVAVLPLMKKER